MTRIDRLVAVAVFGTLLAGVLLVSLAAQPARDERRQSAGSTFEAGTDGARALYEYLDRAGLHPSRVETADLVTPPGAALVILDAELEPGEVEDLLGRVRAGLSLFVASRNPDSELWDALDLEISTSGAPGRVGTAWPAADVQDVSRVEVETAARAVLGENDDETGTMTGAGWVELLADDTGAAAVSRRLGAGEIVVLLDPTVVSNAGLPKGHNLRFADASLRRLSGDGGLLVFDEFHHGHGFERTVTGWLGRAGLLPAAWLTMAIIAIDALRRNRSRLGPPRPPPEPERRAVREFVGSYAGLLLASGHRAYAVRALERQLRRRLQDELGIPFHAAPADVFKLLAVRAPGAAARAYRALERASTLGASGADVGDRDLLDIARDVRAAESALASSRA